MVCTGPPPTTTSVRAWGGPAHRRAGRARLGHHRGHHAAHRAIHLRRPPQYITRASSSPSARARMVVRPRQCRAGGGLRRRRSLAGFCGRKPVPDTRQRRALRDRGTRPQREVTTGAWACHRQAPGPSTTSTSTTSPPAGRLWGGFGMRIVLVLAWALSGMGWRKRIGNPKTAKFVTPCAHMPMNRIKPDRSMWRRCGFL